MLPLAVVAIFVHFAAACLLTLAADALGLMSWRRAGNAHWTERARLLWPARVTSATNIFLLPAMLYFFHRALFPGDNSHWILEGAAAAAGAVVGGYPLDRALFPRMTVRE